MGDAFKYLGEHLVTVTFPMMLGIVILLLTYIRWLNKKR